MAAAEVTPLIAGSIRALEIDRLRPPPLKLRPLDENTVTELMRSIQNLGLLQPIMVRELQGEYEVICGSHRIEAFRRLGIRMIPAIAKRMSNEEAFLARVTENLLRNVQMNPIEEAEGYRLLIRKGWTINAIAKKVGKCDSYVCERLKLLEKLDSRLLQQISLGKGRVTPSHAELLARIPDRHKQTELAEIIADRRLSVRATEALLNGVPLPTRVQVVEQAGTFCLRVPTEFASAMGLRTGHSLRLSIRGRKLIFESSRADVKRQLPQVNVKREFRQRLRLILNRAVSHVRKTAYLN